MPPTTEVRAAQTASIEPPASSAPLVPRPPSTPDGEESPAPPLNIFDSVITHSEEIGDYIGALAKAQGQFKSIERSLTAKVDSKRTGQTYTYDYAPLDVVLDAIRGPLSEAGIAYQQFPAARKNVVTVVTFMAHTSGQWFKNILTVGGPETGDPQAVKSAVTYARRIALEAMCGVSPSHDDDGGAAQRSAEQQPVRPGQSPVRMPQRQPAAPANGAPGNPGSAHPPAPASTAVAPSAPAPVPITLEALEKRFGAQSGTPYWVVAFSNGVKGCTFSTTMGAALEKAKEAGVVYDDVVTHTKGKYTYVDELLPRGGDQ